MAANGRLGDAERACRARQRSFGQDCHKGPVELPADSHTLMYSRRCIACNSVSQQDGAGLPSLITRTAQERVMANTGTVLVLGATRGIGGETARQLRDAGWAVRALTRSGEKSIERNDGITWLHGDALNREDVVAAARGCAVIIHAVNPPGYRRWPELVLPMLDNTIAAAVAERATVVLPGTVYNYGPDAFLRVTERSPQNPISRKGRIRVEMERRLEAFSARGSRVLIVRAGDFFGPQARNNWFSQGLIKPGQAVTKISYPGPRGLGHQWSYLPDVARTIVELLARRDSLEPFARFHMKGHWDPDGTQMVE